MTIRVKITNEDIRENAVIEVQVLPTYRTAEGETCVQLPKTLKGGDSCVEWLHSGNSISVREVSQ